MDRSGKQEEGASDEIIDSDLCVYADVIHRGSQHERRACLDGVEWSQICDHEKLRPWAVAESEAQSAGGHLATIDNEAENIWLATFITNCFPVGHEGDPPWNAAWIGYRQDAGQWGWINGAPATYTNRSQYWDGSIGSETYLHGALHPDAFTWNHVAGIDLNGVIEIPCLMKILGIGVETEMISFFVTNVVPNEVMTLEQCESLILLNWSTTNSTTPTSFAATLSITNGGREAMYFRIGQ